LIVIKLNKADHYLLVYVLFSLPQTVRYCYHYLSLLVYLLNLITLFIKLLLVLL